MRRYFAAGFDLHPAVTAWGVVRHDRLPEVTSVRVGDERDFELAASVDRAVRGAPHGPDLGFLIGEGSQLLVHDDGGYALAWPPAGAGRGDDRGRRTRSCWSRCSGGSPRASTPSSGG